MAISHSRDPQKRLSPPPATASTLDDGEREHDDGQLSRTKVAGITPRAFIIGTLLIPLLVYWIEYTEIVAQGTDLAAMSLIIAAIFALFVLLCVNAVVARFAPRHALSQAEMLFVYIMQTVSLGISGIGMMQFLVPTLGNSIYYANEANGWKDLFSRAIPPYLIPNTTDNPDALLKFYRGNDSLRLEYLSAWAAPIFWWSGFICVLLGSMLCLNVVLRRQWMDNEKLPFPIVYLPLELTRNDPETGPIWRNKLFWGAFAIPVVLETMASLNYLNPGIPALPLKPSTLPNIGAFFTQPPLNAIGYLPLAFYPLVIGLVYFLPVEVSLSSWLFFLLTKFEDVAVVAMGLKAPGTPPALARMPYHGEQGAGAFLALALFGFWSYRKYLSQVLGKALGEKEFAHISDENEPIPYRLAVLGFVIGFLLLSAFGWVGGMVWWLPPAFFALYFLFAVTFTRARAEAGLPWGYGPGINPHGLLTEVAGKTQYDLPSLTMLTLFQWFDMDYRAMAMPHQLEAMKMGSAANSPARLNNRHIYLVILWATLIGVISSWWALLSIYYQYGAATGNVNSWRTSMGSTGFNLLSDWIKNPTVFEINRLYGVFTGMGVTGFLMVARTRFTSWPLHPIGYVLAETSTMVWLWCPTLIGWLLKMLTLRYGGMSLYKKMIPFALGLILGDYIISSLWALIGLYLQIPTYRAFPI
ncbi:MAG: DUF6785 family protein [Armatimonadota bacterium]